MDIRIVTVIYMAFVTIDAVPNIQGNQISRQNGVCDFHPQIKCSSDCSSLMVCYNPKIPPISLKCPTYQPYCSNGKCGAANENCQIQLRDNADSFVCTADGIFPDPTNCTNMYICDGPTATSVSCKAGYIFNSKTYTCDRGTPRIDHASRRICQKISCDNKPNGYILFPANPAYYVYCSSGSMLLYRCDDVENQIFDISSKKCVFSCRAAGYFPDPSDCTIYYLCNKFINTFTISTLYCAEGHYFDGTKCVIGMNCGTTTTSPTIPTPESSTFSITTTEEPTTTMTEEPTTTVTEEPTTTVTEEPTTTVTEEPTSTMTEEPSTTMTEEPTSTMTEEPSTTMTEETTTTPLESTTVSTDYPTVTPSSTTSIKFKDSITEIPFHPLWIHKGKYSYRLGKNLQSGSRPEFL